MAVTTRLIAVFMLVSYSAAMLLVCDGAASPARIPIAAPGHARSWQSPPAQDEGMGHDHGPHPSRLARVRESAAGHVVAARREDHRARAEWKAKCMCGCSDTHFQPGHGTARLGSVVPGTVVARLLETLPSPVPVSSSGPASDLFLEIDPVPV